MEFEPLLDGPSALELEQTIEFAPDIEPELEFEPATWFTK
jgi:hypothetical protein